MRNWLCWYYAGDVDGARVVDSVVSRFVCPLDVHKGERGEARILTQ